jgi:hypothetical protein
MTGDHDAVVTSFVLSWALIKRERMVGDSKTTTCTESRICCKSGLDLQLFSSGEANSLPALFSNSIFFKHEAVISPGEGSQIPH